MAVKGTVFNRFRESFKYDSKNLMLDIKKKKTTQFCHGKQTNETKPIQEKLINK